MFFRLSDRNDVISIASLSVHHENHDAVPQTDGLKTPLSVRIAPILAANRESRENFLRANEIESMLGDVLETLAFIVADHRRIVDAFWWEAKHFVDAKRRTS
jgi:hypothetical protein